MKVRLGKPGDGRCKNFIQIDDWDVWGMDHTLAPIIVPMLKKLKECKQGVPGSMPAFHENEEYHYGTLPEEESDAIFQKAVQQWDEIMDKMIWAFEQIIEDDDSQFWTELPVWDMKDHPTIEGAVVRSRIKGHFDIEGWKTHNEKIQEGLILFGTHFRDLWD